MNTSSVILAIHFLSATDATGSDTSNLLQYGAVGAIALIAIGAVRILYNRQTKDFDSTLSDIRKSRDDEKQRADRLEAELARLNTMMQDQIMRALNDANKAVADAMAATARNRREH